MHKFFWIAAVGSLGILGCEKPSSTSETKPPIAGPAATTVSMPAEIACAHCQYKAPGVTACAPGVKVNGKTYVLTGQPVDVMKEGLCSAPKQATIEGKIEGDKFVATKVDIKK